MLRTNEVGILPCFRFDSGTIYTTLILAMRNHRRLLAMDRPPDLIPPATYRHVVLDEELLLGEASLLPLKSRDILFDRMEQSGQMHVLSEHFMRYCKSIDELHKHDVNSSYMNCIQSYMSKFSETLALFNNKLQPNQVPLLCLEKASQLSFSFEHLKVMGSDDSWLYQLIVFFRQLSDAAVYVDRQMDSITFDSFLFQSDGSLAWFLSYDLLNWDNAGLAVSRDQVAEHNLRVLGNLIDSFFDYFYKRIPPGDNDSYPLLIDYNSSLVRLRNKFKEEGGGFENFDEVFAFWEGRPLEKQAGKIGVFLDTANIYTGLRNMKIDFHELLSTIYGSERVRIKERYAPIFLPSYEDEEKTLFVEEWLRRIGKGLELYGFEVFYVDNGQAKAKQIIDGQEQDVDDLYLIRKIEERMDALDSLFVMSGDDHFYDVLMKCKRAGKKLKIISVHGEDTSDRILMDLKEHHSFITEYSQCITLTTQH